MVGPNDSELYARILPPSSHASIDGTIPKLQTSKQYQYARALVGRPLKSDTITRLAVPETVRQRSDAELTRGNIAGEGDAHGGAAFKKTVLNRWIADDFQDSRANVLKTSIPAQVASAVGTQYTKSGNCGDMAQYFAHHMMCKNTDQTIVTKHIGSHQAWGELEGKQNQEPLVFSPHSREPIMEKTDTVFSDKELNKPQHEIYRMPAASQRSYCEIFQALNPKAMLSRFPVLEHESARVAAPLKEQLESDYSVLKPAFRNELTSALQSARTNPQLYKKAAVEATKIEKLNGCKTDCETTGKLLLQQMFDQWLPRTSRP